MGRCSRGVRNFKPPNTQNGLQYLDSQAHPKPSIHVPNNPARLPPASVSLVHLFMRKAVLNSILQHELLSQAKHSVQVPTPQKPPCQIDHCNLFFCNRCDGLQSRIRTRSTICYWKMSDKLQWYKENWYRQEVEEFVTSVCHRRCTCVDEVSGYVILWREKVIQWRMLTKRQRELIVAMHPERKIKGDFRGYERRVEGIDGLLKLQPDRRYRRENID